jgi:hypothetical protein
MLMMQPQQPPLNKTPNKEGKKEQKEDPNPSQKNKTQNGPQKSKSINYVLKFHWSQKNKHIGKHNTFCYGGKDSPNMVMKCNMFPHHRSKKESESLLDLKVNHK